MTGIPVTEKQITESDVQRIASAVSDKIKHDCHFSDKERAWLHAANENIDKKSLHALGEFARIITQTSTAFARIVIVALLLLGSALGVKFLFSVIGKKMGIN